MLTAPVSCLSDPRVRARARDRCCNRVQDLDLQQGSLTSQNAWHPATNAAVPHGKTLMWTEKCKASLQILIASHWIVPAVCECEFSLSHTQRQTHTSANHPLSMHLNVEVANRGFQDIYSSENKYSFEFPCDVLYIYIITNLAIQAVLYYLTTKDWKINVYKVIVLKQWINNQFWDFKQL